MSITVTITASLDATFLYIYLSGSGRTSRKNVAGWHNTTSVPCRLDTTGWPKNQATVSIARVVKTQKINIHDFY